MWACFSVHVFFSYLTGSSVSVSCDTPAWWRPSGSDELVIPSDTHLLSLWSVTESWCPASNLLTFRSATPNLYLFFSVQMNTVWGKLKLLLHWRDDHCAHSFSDPRRHQHTREERVSQEREEEVCHSSSGFITSVVAPLVLLVSWAFSLRRQQTSLKSVLCGGSFSLVME